MKAMAKGIAVLAMVAALSGCATPGQRQQYEKMDGQASEMDTLREQARNADRPWFRKVDDLWLGADAVKLAPKAKEPEALDAYAVYAPQYPVTLSQVAEYITTRAGVPVQVAPDAEEAAAKLLQDSTMQYLRETAPTEQGVQSFQPAAGQPGAFRLQHRGKVRALLDLVTARTGTSWRWNKNTVTIFKYDTRTFQIYSFAGTTSMENEITSQATGGRSQGQGPSTESSAGQSTRQSTTLDFWATLQTTVQSMVSAGGKVALSPEAGTLTITDVPSVLDRVESYVDDFNAQMTRQVAIDVRVYALEVEEGASQGIDWNIIYEKTSGFFRSVASSGGNSSVDANGIGFGILDPMDNYSGSTVLLNALAESGKLTIKTSATLATLSNRPVPLQIADQTGYVSSVQTTLVPDAGAQTTVTADSVTTGFSANLLPVVMKNDEVMLQVQITLSALQQLRRIAFGEDGDAIEQPEVASRQVMQNVRLRSGASLVLTGFEQESLRSDDRGIGSPTFTLAGGSRGTTSGRTVLVVMITPKVIH